MKKRGFIQITLCLALAFTMIASITPASAACLVKEINNAGDPFTAGIAGGANNDIIYCDDDNLPTGEVYGGAGNDTILVYADDGIARNIIGGNAALPGNDSITIFGGAHVHGVFGDWDTTGGNNSGDDQITIHGIANYLYGDGVNITSSMTTGGDDIIDITGTVNGNFAGDGIFALNSEINIGGNDVITIHEGATLGDDIKGDWINSRNNSNFGGDDIITVAGTVDENVYGDFMAAGTGGNDTIVITTTGSVGQPGTSVNNIFGDYISNTSYTSHGGNDDILIAGTVWGSLWGDYANNSGGADDIIVSSTGFVAGNVYGDWVLNSSATNGTDYIEIIGDVNGSIEGDGYAGNGANDTILIDRLGYVGGNIQGDGVDNLGGTANGGRDRITNKGRVHGDIFGDQVDGNGAIDSIVVQGGSTLNGNSGRVDGDVIGDSAGGNGAKDFITTTPNSQVRGGIFGDNQTRTGGNGGDDILLVGGLVGTAATTTGVYGDKVDGDGGNDFIHILPTGAVSGSVVGDDVNGVGGEDIIWIDGIVTNRVIGDAASGGNKKDRIAIREGEVGLDVVGDGSPNTAGGWDVMNIIGGIVGRDFIGDEVAGPANGGNDFMAVRMNGVIGRDFIGDRTNGGNGGNDTMSLINGVVERDMIGDYVGGHGGDDKMNVLVAGTVKGDLIGDKAGVDQNGGKDSIFVSGKVDGRIYGDHPSKNAFAAADNIQTNPSSVIGNGIYGDNAKGAGRNDTIKVNGKINAGGIRGDAVLGKGGNDDISIFGFGDVKGNVMGDDANGAGGNDTILVDSGGKVTGNVYGDFSNNKGGNDIITIAGTVTGNVAGDRQKSGNPNGGDDTILVDNGGLVQGSVYGDDVPGNGGDDKIDIRGKVNGNVLGDKVGGAGGNDIIRIFPSGVVGGNVCGKNNCTSNPGDNVVFLDESATPSLDHADTIIIAGQVLGNVIAGNSSGHSDDTVVVVEGAEIGGTVYAGDETNGDSFIYIENIINEEKTISEVVNSVTEKDGKVTVNGVTYTLDDVEVVSGAVGQIACFGMDYRMNKSSDGCSARSGAEKDAIQWHLDNPGNDGRLPGLEGCAVYPYGNALRIYEIMDGAQGELVAEIWGDVLSNAPAANELLGATADGRIALYHLASGELQIECRNFVDGKTQVRVLSDLAGTVTGAYDKS